MIVNTGGGIGHSGSSNLFNFREVTSLNYFKYADISYDFHMFVPKRMKPLYETVRQARHWLSGYNPMVHGKLLSSNAYVSIVNLITNSVMSGGIKLDGENSDFLKDLSNKLNIDKTIREASFLAEGLGWSYLKLDIVDGYHKITPISNDQAYLTSKQGKVIEYNGIVNYISSTKAESSDIFLAERRYFKDNMPYVEYDVKQTKSQFESGASSVAFDNCKSMAMTNIDIETVKSFGFETKKELRDALKPRRLPFKDLGVTVLNSSIKNPLYMKSFTSMSNFNKIGMDTLIKYDTVYSAEAHEVATSTRMILSPQDMAKDNRQLISGENTIINYLASLEAQNARPLQHSYMLKLPYESENGESAKPEAVEFKIRSSELSVLKGNVIADIAFAIGFNKDDVLEIKTGSQYEKGGKGEKTSKTIEEKRKYIADALKPLIENILYFYEIEDDVNIIWLGLDFNLLEKQSSIFTTLINSKMMSIKHALKKLYPNLTKKELEEEYQSILRENEKTGEQNNNGFNKNNELVRNISKFKKGENENE